MELLRLFRNCKWNRKCERGFQLIQLFVSKSRSLQTNSLCKQSITSNYDIGCNFIQQTFNNSCCSFTLVIKDVVSVENLFPELCKELLFLNKMGQSLSLFHLFCLFKQTLHFLQQIYVENVMSIQYTALAFQPRTFGTRVSSHNH